MYDGSGKHISIVNSMDGCMVGDEIIFMELYSEKETKNKKRDTWRGDEKFLERGNE